MMNFLIQEDSTASYPPAIVEVMKDWCRDHYPKIINAVILLRESGVYFFPIHNVRPVDFELEDSLVDLDLETTRHFGRIGDWHSLMMVAPPGSIEETLDFAEFAIGEEKGNA